MDGSVDASRPGHFDSRSGGGTWGSDQARKVMSGHVRSDQLHEAIDCRASRICRHRKAKTKAKHTQTGREGDGDLVTTLRLANKSTVMLRHRSSESTRWLAFLVTNSNSQV
ncbi:hypothetical protein SNK03_001023 [Fusarium graminearum]